MGFARLEHCILAFAFGGLAAHAQDVAPRDSAGVQIIEYAKLAPDGAARFRLTPVFKWELADIPPGRGIRTAVRLSDGTIVVAMEGPGELRYYDRGGKPGLITRLNRQTHRVPTSAQLRRLPGDSVLVLDDATRTGSIFGRPGQLSRQIDLEHIGLAWSVPVFDVFSDGTMLVATGPGVTAGFSFVSVRDPGEYVRVSQGGDVLNTLGAFPGNEGITVRMGPEHGELTFMPRYPPLFARRSSAATLGDQFCFVNGEAYEFKIYTNTGALRRIVRVAQPNLPVTSVDLDHDRRTTPERYWTQFLVDNAPATMPALSRVLSDGTSRLWIEEYPHPQAAHARWVAFTIHGSRIGTVDVPRDRRILEWGPAYALVLHEDAKAGVHIEMLDVSPP